MKNIGIVGGIASGKSAVVSRCRYHNYCVVDADKIAHEVILEPVIVEQMKVRWRVDSSGISRLNDYYKYGSLFDQNVPKRNGIGNLVFANQDELVFLEEILKSKIDSKIEDFIKAISPKYFNGVVLDVPLLFESGWDKSCDEIWFIDSSFDSRTRRYYLRNIASFFDVHDAIQNLELRESCQLSLEEKKKHSTHFITNEDSLKELFESVDELLLGK